MSALVLSMLGSLGAIGYSMLAKLIGYEFVTRTTIIGARAVAESTKTHRDDEVVEEFAKAWGVPPAQLKELVK